MNSKICKLCGIEKTIENFRFCSGYYRNSCKPCENIYSKKYRENNEQKIKQLNKDYYKQNKTQEQERCRVYRENNKEKISVQNKKWRLQNKNKRNQNRLFRKQNDTSFKIQENLRRRLNSALKGKTKSKRTLKLLGCTIEELKIHLELQFQENMTWENYGYYGWHIDHIIPCNSFDLIKDEEQEKCFHYSNLQPLWWQDNLRKGNKI